MSAGGLAGASGVTVLTLGVVGAGVGILSVSVATFGIGVLFNPFVRVAALVIWPIVVGAIIAPILVAFFLVIIQSGAFMVPVSPGFNPP